ncbi:hypothetical protein L1987_14222 [Smallanthus sonchifolius]|uniref:Uncharacterized protein n=1 Tax=Smallanthus sonchifolius TaxID=185202 RepID=A0ACB9J2N3_9ASTR|nr:hypothetical protein L1987_14222 [Smallanthus sonchifolius]
MGYNSTQNYLKLLSQLAVNENVNHDIVSSLIGYVKPTHQSDLDNCYSEPMLWIGLYITLASLCCILAMVADLVHGLKSRKPWFPCKYFSVNAASLSVISVAMKLPVDLSGSMPGDVDQVAKLGSMAFMCTMIANLLPCLATMDSNELLTNIIALGVLIIESKYQQGNETASEDVRQSTGTILTVEKLKNHFSNYWVMSGSDSPQFIIACSVTTTGSGVELSSSGETPENLEQRRYVLQHENEMKLADRTLEGFSKSMNRLIQNGEKKQPNNLKKLIVEKSTPGFQGVKKFDNSHYVPSLLSEVEYQECWSLPVVTLTTIAVTLPDIEKAEVDSLLKSVREGLEYVTLVEENLNTSDDYVSIHKPAETLWQEVDVCQK